MMAFKEKYKASKPWKKVLVFNTYSLVLALIMFVVRYLVELLVDFFIGEPYSIDYLSLLKTNLVLGYIFCFLALYTRFFKDKKKKEDKTL